MYCSKKKKRLQNSQCRLQALRENLVKDKHGNCILPFLSFRPQGREPCFAGEGSSQRAPWKLPKSRCQANSTFQRDVCAAQREGTYREYHSMPAIEHHGSQVHVKLPTLWQLWRRQQMQVSAQRRVPWKQEAQLPPAGSFLYPLPVKFRLHNHPSYKQEIEDLALLWPRIIAEMILIH